MVPVRVSESSVPVEPLSVPLLVAVPVPDAPLNRPVPPVMVYVPVEVKGLFGCGSPTSVNLPMISTVNVPPVDVSRRVMDPVISAVQLDPAGGSKFVRVKVPSKVPSIGVPWIMVPTT